MRAARLVLIVLLLSGCGGGGSGAKAPNFNADDLAAPSSGWSTNGGSLTNARYSPLDEINAENVAQLKGVWHTNLDDSGTAAKYSGESQPIFFDGVLYVTTGNDDVFAIDVDDGTHIWTHKSGISQEIDTVCCGWLNRGVAIGDGRVYLGQLDGNVVALDQKTGDEVWTTKLQEWQRGYTITGAPLYLDGKLYIGVVGAEYGIRAFVQALDAKTGKKLWRFYTVAGPGEPGGETWPRGTDEFRRGGASVWQTPAVDPDLGLMYFSTGNAGSDWYGGDREGKNLYAASIVALDIDTGTVKWSFQQVHHDIWDYDSPSPVVLFDAAGGKKGVAQASKTGWLYMLDRTNGKPLYGIDEKPVPQYAPQKTWPTQPIPRSGEFIPHGPVPDTEVKRIARETTGAAKKLPVAVADEIFTPPPVDKLLVYAPGPLGGNNWEPISYNPKTHMIYVCAAEQTIGIGAGKTPFVSGKTYTGSRYFVGGGWPEAIGYVTAIDANSGDRAWQNRWPEPCYSGTVTTAGNLVFVGRNAGQLQALDARSGKQLWSFQTGAGANDTPAVFEWKGTEYVAFLAAGNSLMATPHGDDFWLFSLDGKLGPAKPPTKGQGTEHAGEGGGKHAAPGQGNADAGKSVFASNCSVCHGALGTGGNGGPDLTGLPDAKNRSKVIAQVENGGGGMPPFKDNLTPKQVQDVAAYVTDVIAKKKGGG